MKRKFTLALLSLFLLGIQEKISAQTTFASINSGYWGQTTPYIWETFISGAAVGAQGTGTAATGVPSGTHNVYVRNGHTLSTGTSAAMPNISRNANNITIETGGTLSVGNATETTLNPGTGISGSTGLTSTLINNGILGGTSDGLVVQVGIGSTSLTISGTGTAQIARLRFNNNNLNSSSSLILDQDVILTTTNYALSATGSSNNLNDNHTLTINTGRTVSITRGYLHNSGISGGAAGSTGNFIYNINGTLDLSSSTSVSNSTFVGSTDITKSVIVNINGTLKLPTSGTSSLNLSESGATGQQGAVIFNINNGGLLDGNIAPINSTTTTLPIRYFAISGTGQLRRTVGGGTDILFAVGTPATYNPVTINNTGTSDNFSVNVKNTFDETPPASKRVDRQWIINEGTAGGTTATLKFAWTTADQTAGFTTASPVYIYHYNGSVWDATLATVTGSGTTADPYVATASGFTSFSPFAVGNDVTLPVSFINNKAFTQGSGVQVEWTTALESGVSNFVVERSADGRNFTDAGTVAINRNNTYSWFDATPFSGVNYYRIRSVEVYGGSKYTAIMKVSIGKKGAEMIIASNPVKGGLLSLQLSGMEKGVYTLALFNNAGQQVFAKSISMEGGSLSQGILLPHLSGGMYSVQLRNNGMALTKNIVLE